MVDRALENLLKQDLDLLLDGKISLKMMKILQKLRLISNKKIQVPFFPKFLQLLCGCFPPGRFYAVLIAFQREGRGLKFSNHDDAQTFFRSLEVKKLHWGINKTLVQQNY